MQKIAILYDASQAVLSTFDLDEVLRRILEILRDYFQIQHSAILLVDEDSGELCIRSSLGWPAERAALCIPFGRGIAGEAAKSRCPIYVPDVKADKRYLELIPEAQSELAIPLMVRDNVVGVLVCKSDSKSFFDRETVDLLILFSTQASIALQNATLHQMERRHASILEAINAIARQTTAVTDLNELLSRTCKLLLEAFGVDHVAVLLLEENRLVLRAHTGHLTLRLRDGADMPAAAGLAGRALSSRVPVLVNDVSEEPEYVAAVREAQSEVCLPLISFGQPVGVLSLASARKNAFRVTDLGSLECVADISAAAFQNAMYLDRVRQLAYRDGLTGIFNRRFFEMRILEELERARRHHLSLAIMMIDLDGFKGLNDEFGHLLGDEALRQMAAIFLEQMRKADVVCRFGGDEFAILLPETSGQNAQRAAEKLRRTVAGWDFPGVPRPMTVSVGIACFPEHGSSRDDLIKSADDALYRAKQEGRNRVVLSNIAVVKQSSAD